MNFDAEDVLNELWVKLAEKDGKWAWERGSYLNFSASVCNTVLDRLRDRARTVKTPGNSRSRLRKYEAKQAAGTLKPGEAKTMADLRRAVAGKLTLAGHDPDLGGRDIPGSGEAADRPTIRHEEKSDAFREITLRLAALTVEEAGVLGEAFGLWDQPLKSPAAIARSRGKTVGRIREITEAALRKFQSFAPERNAS